MEQPSRLFYCLLCRDQVVICTYCDRGQVYCGKECSTKEENNYVRDVHIEDIAHPVDACPGYNPSVILSFSEKRSEKRYLRKLMHM